MPLGRMNLLGEKESKSILVRRKEIKEQDSLFFF